MPSPAKACPALSSRRIVAREEVTARAATTLELPSFLPFLTSGLLEPLESGVVFSSPKREYISLCWLDEHSCLPFTHPVHPRGEGTKWEDALETTKHSSLHVSQRTNSLDYAG